MVIVITGNPNTTNPVIVTYVLFTSGVGSVKKMKKKNVRLNTNLNTCGS